MRTRIPSLLCTTGWRDWSKGALLVTENALLRVPIEMLHPMGDQFRSMTVQAGKPLELDISRPVYEQLAAAPKRVVKIDKDKVVSASIREGIINGRVTVVLDDGSKKKLLWLKREGTYDFLCPILERWIPGRVTYK